MSDPPATSEIASFSNDGGIAPSFGLFSYGAVPQPTYTVSAGMVNVTNTIEIGATIIDPKAAGPVGSYPPQLAIISPELTSTGVTIEVPFAGSGAPFGGSPATPIDPFKLVSLLWQMTTPIASDGGAAECVWKINVSNVRFYE